MFDNDQPGFSVHSIDGKVHSVRFWCDVCDYSDYMVSLYKIDKNGKYIGGSDCCKSYAASPQTRFAIQIIDQQNQFYIEKCRTEETNRNLNGYIWLGAAPLFIGVLFQSSGLIQIGVGTTVLCIAIYLFGYFRK